MSAGFWHGFYVGGPLGVIFALAVIKPWKSRGRMIALFLFGFLIYLWACALMGME